MILYNPTVSGSLVVTGSLTTTGTITSQTLVVQTITSSVSYLTGSTQHGSVLTNTHEFTGSLSITSSAAALLNVNNSVLYVSSSGNVGIGTITPSTKLHVYEPLTNTSAYLTVQNNRSRNAAVLTQTSNGGFYAGTSIGTDTFNYQIYDAVAGEARLTISSTGAATFSNLITVSGFGNSTFSSAGTGYNKLTIRNTTAGTGNGAQLSIGTNADADQFYVQSFATTFTTSGMNIAGGAVVNGEGPGGLSIAATQSSIGFYTNGAGAANLRMTITSAGNVGIGTSSINSEKLTVNQTTGNASALLVNTSGVTAGQSYGLTIQAGTNSSDRSFLVANQGGSTNYLLIRGDGEATFSTVVKASSYNITVDSGFRGGLYPYKIVSGAGTDYGMTIFAEGGTNNGNIYFCVNGSVTKVMTIATTGAVTIAGSLSKGSGSFRIEHPLISKKNTHQLVHSFIEGPQADLIYRGKIRLNAGKAIINIDEVSTMTEGTFEALCREVQCFTTNETGWDAVKGKVTGNILTIESQNTESTDEISWMVVGERQDEHMIDTEWTDDEGKVIVEPLITE